MQRDAGALLTDEPYWVRVERLMAIKQTPTRCVDTTLTLHPSTVNPVVETTVWRIYSLTNNSFT